MVVQLEVSDEILAQAREHAAVSGQNLEAFVIEALEDKLASCSPIASAQSANRDDWNAKFDAWIASHPIVTHPVDASRDAIYDDRFDDRGE
jgi:hypothetical protein